METRPDNLDKDVFTSTLKIRKLYEQACIRIGNKPRELTPVTLMQRSVA